MRVPRLRGADAARRFVPNSSYNDRAMARGLTLREQWVVVIAMGALFAGVLASMVGWISGYNLLAAVMGLLLIGVIPAMTFSYLWDVFPESRRGIVLLACLLVGILATAVFSPAKLSGFDLTPYTENPLGWMALVLVVGIAVIALRHAHRGGGWPAVGHAVLKSTLFVIPFVLRACALQLRHH